MLCDALSVAIGASLQLVLAELVQDRSSFLRVEAVVASGQV
jgi:hypothetical protein